MNFNFGILIPIVAVAGWVVIVLGRMRLAGEAREQVHRERMAMIERGLVPPPESDPQQFERLMDPTGRYRDRPHRSLRTGIILMAVGVGISIQGYLTPVGKFGWGSGAFLFCLGVAFLVVSMFEAPSHRDREPRAPTDKP